MSHVGLIMAGSAAAFKYSKDMRWEQGSRLHQESRRGGAFQRKDLLAWHFYSGAAFCRLYWGCHSDVCCEKRPLEQRGWSQTAQTDSSMSPNIWGQRFALVFWRNQAYRQQLWQLRKRNPKKKIKSRRNISETSHLISSYGSMFTCLVKLQQKNRFHHTLLNIHRLTAFCWAPPPVAMALLCQDFHE